MSHKRTAALALTGWLAGCVGSQSPDNAALCRAFAAGRSQVEVITVARVVRDLGSRPGVRSPHQGFLIRPTSSCDVIIRVEANEDFTGPIPVREGEVVTVKGEYEYYAQGGVIHWTHRDPRLRHQSGYVEAAGTYYQ